MDHLSGLKENVIIGKLIPAGTGMKRYRNVQIETNDDEMLLAEDDFYEDEEPAQQEIDEIDEAFAEADAAGDEILAEDDSPQGIAPLEDEDVALTE